MNTVRYIHGNPKAAGIQQGWFYDYSNYGSYDRLADDGITEWHPAFLALGATLDLCAAAYREFCKYYKPQPKPAKKKRQWGRKLLPKIKERAKKDPKKKKKKKKQQDPPESPESDQKTEDPTTQGPELDPSGEEVQAVAEKFVLANCWDPEYVKKTRFTREANTPSKTSQSRDGP